jgi:ribosomal RNA assembly protein
MYTYEFDVSDIKVNELEKLLKERNIKYNKNKNKIIVYYEDFYFLYKFDKFVRGLKAGFDIKKLLNILDNDWDILEIDLKLIFEKKINHIIRIKGRIIGEEGKVLEELKKRTNADIIIKDKYIYILGDNVSLQSAYEGIKRIIKGEKHGTVFNYLDKYIKDLKNKDKEFARYIK